ncbi:hypothetical protein [Streptomyces sp. MUSC 14]|uniref:hypothetical protein n=1 Tax=Streptomyces sp. MUSC 14 TaxID=1354889 RepID=UPI0015A6FFC2|nr:hypothetical protein [Streptomyces sp. MUSC 14]
MKDQIRRPGADLTQRLADAVHTRWQPRVREQVRRQAATSTGLATETRARFGPTAPPPAYAARLFDGQQAGDRAYLRRRGVRCTIPSKADQPRNRKKQGSSGGRSPEIDPVDDRARHAVECGINL